MCKTASFKKKSERIHKKLLMVEMSIIEIRHLREEKPYSF